MSKFYITTSIPYVNAEPHLGHAMEFIQADALARYHRARGAEVVFSTGTDEHGGKNAEAAKELGLTPKQHVDNLSQQFKDLCELLNVSYDRFIRTTDRLHTLGAQTIWKKLKPHIYKDTYKGMYDQRQEEFITMDVAREMKKTDPERYARLSPIEEENYFFKLSDFAETIEKAIGNGSFRIVPASRKHEVLALFKSGLKDISISRPKAKIGWGIAVPDDKDQVIYVWFEALMNYITVLAYPHADDLKKFWPADVQIVGKDITRFHAAIWPAILLGIGLPLPKTLYAHGFITVDGQKMSKSVGNVVKPKDIVDEFGVDPLRYYLLRHIPSYDDGDFSHAKMLAAYNGELGNELGNLVQRISAMINKYQDGTIGDVSSGEHDTGPYNEAVENFRFDKALEYTFGLVRGLNQYIDEERPWEIAGSDPAHLQEVLAYAVGSLLQISDLLDPFMPATAAAIRTSYEHGVVKQSPPLFPRIETEVKDE